MIRLRYFPSTIDDMHTKRTAMPAILWFTAAVVAPDSPSVAALRFTASGHAFAAVSLCGFGDTGGGSRSLTAGLGPGQAVPDLAHEMYVKSHGIVCLIIPPGAFLRDRYMGATLTISLIV